MHFYVPVMSLSSNDILASISRADKGKARFEKGERRGRQNEQIEETEGEVRKRGKKREKEKNQMV